MGNRSSKSKANIVRLEARAKGVLFDVSAYDTVAFTYADTLDPSVERVYRIAEKDDTIAEPVRDDIYEYE